MGVEDNVEFVWAARLYGELLLLHLMQVVVYLQRVLFYLLAELLVWLFRTGLSSLLDPSRLQSILNLSLLSNRYILLLPKILTRNVLCKIGSLLVIATPSQFFPDVLRLLLLASLLFPSGLLLHDDSIRKISIFGFHDVGEAPVATDSTSLIRRHDSLVHFDLKQGLELLVKVLLDQGGFHLAAHRGCTGPTSYLLCVHSLRCLNNFWALRCLVIGVVPEELTVLGGDHAFKSFVSSIFGCLLSSHSLFKNGRLKQG